MYGIYLIEAIKDTICSRRGRRLDNPLTLWVCLVMVIMLSKLTVDSLHKGPVMWKPYAIIMRTEIWRIICWRPNLYTGIILWMRPANERWCYMFMLYLIGWLHTQNDSWIVYATSQLEMALHCNTISHWLGEYIEWSLIYSRWCCGGARKPFILALSQGSATLTWMSLLRGKESKLSFYWIFIEFDQT